MGGNQKTQSKPVLIFIVFNHVLCFVVAQDLFYFEFHFAEPCHDFCYISRLFIYFHFVEPCHMFFFKVQLFICLFACLFFITLLLIFVCHGFFSIMQLFHIN